MRWWMQRRGGLEQAAVHSWNATGRSWSWLIRFSSSMKNAHARGPVRQRHSNPSTQQLSNSVNQGMQAVQHDFCPLSKNYEDGGIVFLLSWIVTNLLSYAVTNLSDKSACICQKNISNRLIALFMRIPHGCQGRQRRLYSLDSHVEYAYTLAAIDKLESK